MMADISVIGSADRTGDQVTNQDLGRMRAQAVRTILLQELPQGRVTIYPAESQGDQPNRRMVTITWRLVPQPLAQKSRSAKLLGTIVAGIIVLLVFIYFLKSEKRHREWMAKTEPPLVSSKTSDVRWFSTTYEGKAVEVRLELAAFDAETLKWRTPFPAPNQWREEWSAAKSAVKSALKNPNLKPAIAQAIAAGDIRLKGETNV
jgi:hypothetical protein